MTLADITTDHNGNLFLTDEANALRSAWGGRVIVRNAMISEARRTGRVVTVWTDDGCVSVYPHEAPLLG